MLIQKTCCYLCGAVWQPSVGHRVCTLAAHEITPECVAVRSSWEERQLSWFQVYTRLYARTFALVSPLGLHVFPQRLDTKRHPFEEFGYTAVGLVIGSFFKAEVSLAGSSVVQENGTLFICALRTTTNCIVALKANVKTTLHKKLIVQALFAGDTMHIVKNNVNI